MVIRKKIVGKSHRKIPTSDIEATYNDSTAGIPTVLLFVLKPIVQKVKTLNLIVFLFSEAVFVIP